jgi:hypothetical protein
MTLGISINCRYVECRISYCYAECRISYCYAECRISYCYAECRISYCYAECLCAECYRAKCRGALKKCGTSNIKHIKLVALLLILIES